MSWGHDWPGGQSSDSWNDDGQEAIEAQAETFWSDFLCKLQKRGLQGVKLVISDAHEGLKAAIARVFKATWQRCRVHFMRNALAHVAKGQRQTVAAIIRTAFAQETAEAASQPFAVS